MIEGLFIKTNYGLQFANDETEEKFKRYGLGEIIPVKSYVKYKKRVAEQLNLFWACMTLVAQNNKDIEWNTAENARHQCMWKFKLFDNIITYPDGSVSYEFKSMSMALMDHWEATGVINDILGYAARKIGLDKDDLINEAKSRMKRKV